MKKITIGFFIVIIVSFGIAITVNEINKAKEINEFTFDGLTFEHVLTDDENIETYRSTDYDIDIKVEEEQMLIFFEKEEDIYIVETNYETVSIRVNGTTTSICQREGRSCSGFETTGLEDDIFDLINLKEQ